MSIVFLNIYNGLVSRGAERSTHELAHRLSERFAVTLIQGGPTRGKAPYRVYSFPPLGPDRKDLSFSLLRRYYLDWWSLEILLFTLRALPVLLRGKFDIVVPVNGGWQVVLCRLLTWIQRKKMVVIGRAGVGRDDRWNLLFRPDAFVALTKVAESWAKKLAPRVKSVTIPNGIDTLAFRPDVRKAEIPLKPPIVLAACALTPQKRVAATIHAVSLLPNVSLLVVGDGILRTEIEEEGRRLLGANRFCLVSVPAREMPHMYAAADVVSHVSQTGEAFGNVYLEALATNRPVVATDDATRHEIIGEAGVFVDPQNRAAYADGLRKALKKHWGNLPRLRAENFSWERIVNAYERLFRTI